MRDVLVDREGDCRCPDSRKDPGSSLFSKLVSDTKSISGMLTISEETENSIPLESFIKY